MFVLFQKSVQMLYILVVSSTLLCREKQDGITRSKNCGSCTSYLAIARSFEMLHQCMYESDLPGTKGVIMNRRILDEIQGMSAVRVYTLAVD